MNFQIESNSNYLKEELRFTVNLKNWTSNEVQIQINFTYPELISKGKQSYDKLNIKILNQTLFKSLLYNISIENAQDL